MSKRDSYPLQWPAGWPQTPPDARETHNRFVAQFALDRDELLNQLDLMGAANVVITSDLPTRGDGRPYANSRCENPAIAVYWIDSKGHERVLACDRWKTISQNLRAILLTIKAIRGIDRWGASEIVERAFSGFAALPEKASESSWRELLGDGDLATIKVRYRALAQTTHPDYGGSQEGMMRLNEAMRMAETELGGVR